MATATVDRQVVLETQGLGKRFGGLRAVNDVDLVIPHGDLRAIIGPNGAGKTLPLWKVKTPPATPEKNPEMTNAWSW